MFHLSSVLLDTTSLGSILPLKESSAGRNAFTRKPDAVRKTGSGCTSVVWRNGPSIIPNLTPPVTFRSTPSSQQYICSVLSHRVSLFIQHSSTCTVHICTFLGCFLHIEARSQPQYVDLHKAEIALLRKEGRKTIEGGGIRWGRRRRREGHAWQLVHQPDV